MGTIISILVIYFGGSLVWKAGKNLWNKSLKGKVNNAVKKIKKK